MARTIAEAGGEHALIAAIAAGCHRPDVLLGPGDDAAIVRPAGRPLVVTTDMLVEGDHFTPAWCPAEHVGIKAAASSLSDVAAMGASPCWAVVSMCLRPETEASWVEGVETGLCDELRGAGADLVGGDLTHGPLVVISVALVGELAGSRPLCRSGARPGDRIWVTGPLGGARAGLRALQEGVTGYPDLARRHTAPRARTDLVPALLEVASAAIDVSDGLASEVSHLCREGGVGAVVRAAAVPLDERTRRLAARLGEDPLLYALGGGEDLEILFTAPDSEAARAIAVEVGEITSSGEALLDRGGRLVPLDGLGYDHFAPSPARFRV
jgi:thiamine-monophosphate kinase